MIDENETGDDDEKESPDDDENKSPDDDEKESLDDDENKSDNKSGDDDEDESWDYENKAVTSNYDENKAVSSEEDDNVNKEQAEPEDDFRSQQEEDGCSGGTKKRRRFTLQEKLMYLRVVQRKLDKGISLVSIKIDKHFPQANSRLEKQVERMKGKSNQHAKSLGDGVTSFLSLYTDRLLSFIFEMRETGMAVSVNSVVLKASQLSREFREKSITARHSAVHRFINVHGFMHQMGTHLSQCQPSEMEEIAADFVRVTWEKLQMSCRDEAYIINMEQTPVPFSYDPKKPLKRLDKGQFISGSQHPIRNMPHVL